MRMTFFLLALICSACSNSPSFSIDESTIHLDKGTVYLTISDQPMQEMHSIRLRSGDDCTPTLTYKKYNHFTQVKHQESCSMDQENRSSIFDVTLANNQFHRIHLNAGEIVMPAIERTPNIRRIEATVLAGEINGGGKLTHKKRKLITGAQATAVNPKLNVTIQLLYKRYRVISSEIASIARALRSLLAFGTNTNSSC